MAKELPLKEQTKETLYGRWQGMLDAAAATGQALPRELQVKCDAIEEELESRDKKAMIRGTAGLRHNPDLNSRPAGGSGFAYRDANQQWVCSVGPDQSIAECIGGQRPSAHPAEFGEWLSNEILGRPQMQASLRTDRDASGGFAVPELLATTVLDYARAKQVTARAGVRTIQLPAASQFAMATLTSDPTAVWRRETVAITASEPTFGRIQMFPRVLACLVPVTVEMLEDCANAADIITSAISNSIACALDAAVLHGDAGAEPTGIVNYTGVNSSSLGRAFTYDDLINMQLLPMQANGPDKPTAFILTPAGMIAFRKLKDGDGQYMLGGDSPINAIPFLASTSCPTNTIISGDFSQVVIGMRTALKVEVLDSGTADDSAGGTFNATTQLGKWLRLYLRCDTWIERPTWLSVYTNAT